MTPKTPRLIATDLDGTIIRSDGTISARTVAAFARAERAGSQVVFVTGRPPGQMAGVVAAFGPHGTAICSNGALVQDLRTGRVIEEHPIAITELTQAAKLLRELFPGIGLAIEYADELAGDPYYAPDDWDGDVVIQRLADDLLFGRPGHKLLGRHPELSADELLAAARPVLGDLVTVYHSNGKGLIEASAAGVNKASALADLARRRGFDRADVAAFGDMPNDLPMLTWAGTSYGVANAHPDVLSAVDHVIGHHDEDGVCATLERLFPEGAHAEGDHAV
ncbi:HAD family hydrolase [Streptomyces sp. NPDC059837]|uniref:HAD family hydrolase n=1 Tax=unclassified Streptomyces TaxID=2593676 RepID=UPI002259B8B1|nr:MULTISPECIES: HAD hydrolase family protein [unclassified Streptomyces]MCX4402685.1 HAD hydrolase family protein [Streptomyces sp. NBC_01764]MCX5182343.1 HAD hydrolase family protein [Streptomyces sp. NBC_00268]